MFYDRVELTHFDAWTSSVLENRVGRPVAGCVHGRLPGGHKRQPHSAEQAINEQAIK